MNYQLHVPATLPAHCVCRVWKFLSDCRPLEPALRAFGHRQRTWRSRLSAFMITQQAEVMHSYHSPTVRASEHADSVKVLDFVSVRHPAVALTAACGVRLYCHTAWRSACGLLGQARQGCSEDPLWTKVASPDLKPNSSTRKTGGPIHRRGGGGGRRYKRIV